jgi:hypothetical protein
MTAAAPDSGQWIGWSCIGRAWAQDRHRRVNAFDCRPDLIPRVRGIVVRQAATQAKANLRYESDRGVAAPGQTRGSRSDASEWHRSARNFCLSPRLADLPAADRTELIADGFLDAIGLGQVPGPDVAARAGIWTSPVSRMALSLGRSPHLPPQSSYRSFPRPTRAANHEMRSALAPSKRCFFAAAQARGRKHATTVKGTRAARSPV